MDECIKDNLINRNLCSYSIVEHIAYCKDNMLDYALSAAEELCLADWAYSSDKLIALEYIDMLKNDNANDYSYIYASSSNFFMLLFFFYLELST